MALSAISAPQLRHSMPADYVARVAWLKSAVAAAGAGAQLYFCCNVPRQRRHSVQDHSLRDGVADDAEHRRLRLPAAARQPPGAAGVAALWPRASLLFLDDGTDEHVPPRRMAAPA